jgi:hypothetical protein
VGADGGVDGDVGAGYGMSVYDYNGDALFVGLVGKTLCAVTGLEAGSDEAHFTTDDGETFRMQHDQDCCEAVNIESVVGDVSALIGEPILRAEVVSSTDWPEGTQKPDYDDESFTWTFYKLATRKGYVDVRWYGSSNGYYSESVTFSKVAT